MKGKAKKQILFSKIENRSDAERMTQACAYGFFTIAILQGAFGLLFPITNKALILDAIVWLILGLLILKIKSRIAATIALLMSLISLFVTFQNKITPDQGMGGSNIILAIIIFLVSIRALEATVKLGEKFKDTNSITRIE